MLLIVGALAGTVVMLLHPTGTDLGGAHAVGQVRLNLAVHSLAIAGVPVTFIGFVGLSRRMLWTDFAVAATVIFGFGGVAVMGAAVWSGFVTPEVIGLIRDANGADTAIPAALLHYSGSINQAFAKVFVVASSVAIALWAIGMLRERHLSRAAAIAGVVIGALIVLAQLSGHLVLDVHGFGVVTFAQSAWIIWIGVLLVLRNGVLGDNEGDRGAT